ncbi:MAG: tRNA (adenosine(37)-N6)-threonylcarbamoyltransferase complex transferase subunit TsaD, partial [Candidatus Zambryskibacteria bacterium CG_4_9_14_3_um_filter_42_9]
AKREHQKNLPPLLEQTLLEAGESLEKPNIDVIAVTSGPGLEPALWVGINFALELGKKWGKPVMPVNHMEGHIYSVLYQDKFSIFNFQFSKLELPALALLV